MIKNDLKPIKNEAECAYTAIYLYLYTNLKLLHVKPIYRVRATKFAFKP